MKYFVLALAFSCGLFFTSRATAAFGPDIDPKPVFEENFDKIDSTVWEVAGWVEESKTSPARCTVSNGMLNMIFKYDSASKSNLGSALQTRQTFLYGRWEYRAKPSDVKGVLNSFYTIDWGDKGKGTRQEIDIEFLTFQFGKGSGRVHCAVHAAGKKSFDTHPDAPLSFNPSEDFHIYGFEVTPEKIEWFADKKVICSYTYSGNDIKIDAPYMLKMNFWSNKNWIKGPPPGDVECVYQIDWIKFYPYIGNKK